MSGRQDKNKYHYSRIHYSAALRRGRCELAGSGVLSSAGMEPEGSGSAGMWRRLERSY